MKKLLLFSVTILLTQLIPSTSTFADTPSSRIIGLSLTEGDTLQTSLTILAGRTPQQSEGFGVYCDGLDDIDCVGKIISVRAFLLPCTERSTLACIKEVYAKSPDGTKIPAQFIRSIAASDDYDFSEDITRGLVSGSGTGGEWEIPGLVHGGGTTKYAVQARLEGFLGTNSGPTYDRIEFGIAAVKELSGAFIPNKPEFQLDSPDSRVVGLDAIGSNGRPDFKCVMTQTGRCFERTSFPEKHRFGMTVKLPKQLSGWFHGRIFSPEISIAPSGNGFDYTIEAAPVKVPYIREEKRSATWGESLINFVNSNFTCNPNCIGTGGGFMMPGNSGKFAFDLTNLFLPVVQDKATGTGDYWSVRTLDFWGDAVENRNIESCSATASAVSGIVTTNSMVYSAGPPIFNQGTSSLDYKVLSPHYNEKNEENFGSYDLLLDSKVARCIYKFTDAPVKAEIEIFGSDGSNKVATTVIGEKNGWLFMSANGFTYSEPTVRIKLIQDAPPPTPTPTPTPSATPTVDPGTSTAVVSSPGVKPTRKAITCVKGKNTKKFTAVKCPKGWKKKA